jgi:hypothetical protein
VFLLFWLKEDRTDPDKCSLVVALTAASAASNSSGSFLGFWDEGQQIEGATWGELASCLS